MKMLYIANVRLPTEKAHGIQIMHMCEAFAKLGHQVELIIPDRHNAIKEDPFVFYAMERSFEIMRVPCLDWMHLGRAGFFIETMSFFRSVSRIVRKRPDSAIYTREPLAPLFFPTAIVEIHLHSGSRLVQFAIRRAQQVVTITRGLKQAYIRDGIPAARITVLPDGVDYDRFATSVSQEEARRITGLPSAPIALYSGSFSLYSWKGFDTFVEAARYSPDTIFVCVGGSAKEAERVVGPLPSNVRCEGRMPYNLIPLYLRAADVLALPNKAGDPVSEFYTSPLKLFEYMASGTPVVASDLPSIREVLNEEAALLVRPGDARLLAEAIKASLADKSAAQNRSNLARRQAALYSWEGRARKASELLRNA